MLYLFQSGYAGQLFTMNVTEARYAAFQLDKTFNCSARDSSQALIDCLRDVPAQDLLEATDAVG